MSDEEAFGLIQGVFVVIKSHMREGAIVKAVGALDNTVYALVSDGHSISAWALVDEYKYLYH